MVVVCDRLLGGSDINRKVAVPISCVQAYSGGDLAGWKGEVQARNGRKWGTDMELRIATTDSHSNLIVYAPWLVEKLALSATETVAQPSNCDGVLERQRVQKGDPVLWKRVSVERELEDAGVEEREEDEEEGKERH